jgi:hypothetical protein
VFCNFKRRSFESFGKSFGNWKGSYWAARAEPPRIIPGPPRIIPGPPDHFPSPHMCARTPSRICRHRSPVPAVPWPTHAAHRFLNAPLFRHPPCVPPPPILIPGLNRPLLHFAPMKTPTSTHWDLPCASWCYAEPAKSPSSCLCGKSPMRPKPAPRLLPTAGASTATPFPGRTPAPWSLPRVTH